MEEDETRIPSVITYELPLRNTGNLPVFVKVKWLKKDKEITEEDFKKLEFNEDALIMPNEISKFYVQFPYDLLEKGKRFYYSFSAEYELPDKSISEIGKMWQVDKYTTSIIYDWLDDPQLKSGRLC